MTLNLVTFDPTASITPAHSNPMVDWIFGGSSIVPCLAIKSEKFNPLCSECSGVCRCVCSGVCSGVCSECSGV